MSKINIISTSKCFFDNSNFIQFNTNIDLSYTSIFIDFITKGSSNFLNFNLFKYIDFNHPHFIDFERIQVESFQQYKLLLLLSASVFKSIKLDRSSLDKYNKDELLEFITDLYIYFKNSNLDNSFEILYKKDDVLIYSIDSSYFLYNFSSTPKKIILPEVLQNKTFYSVFCNNDKYTKECFILGKYYFALFEEIDKNTI